MAGPMGKMPFIGAGLVLVQLVPSLFFGSWTPTVQAAWIWPCVRSGYSTEVCQEMLKRNMTNDEVAAFEANLAKKKSGELSTTSMLENFETTSTEKESMTTAAENSMETSSAKHFSVSVIFGFIMLSR